MQLAPASFSGSYCSPVGCAGCFHFCFCFSTSLSLLTHVDQMFCLLLLSSLSRSKSFILIWAINFNYQTVASTSKPMRRPLPCKSLVNFLRFIIVLINVAREEEEEEEYCRKVRGGFVQDNNYLLPGWLAFSNQRPIIFLAPAAVAAVSRSNFSRLFVARTNN